MVKFQLLLLGTVWDPTGNYVTYRVGLKMGETSTINMTVLQR